MIINTRMTEQCFIAKVFRQHNSLVIVLPYPVCIAVGIKAGDHAVFLWRQTEGGFEFTKFKPVGADEGTDKRGTDRPDQGGKS